MAEDEENGQQQEPESSGEGQGDAKQQQAPLATLASTQSPSEQLKKTLQDTLSKVHPNVDYALSETKTDVDIACTPDTFLPLVQTLKDRRELAFDFLRNLAGIDFEEAGLTCKYHFFSTKHNYSVQVTVVCPPDDPTIPSLTSLYRAANWHEREAAEMFGFHFEGHPYLKNLLLEEDLYIHPLLKAHPLQKPEILQGIEDGPPGFEF
ncbi:MAG: NADH-quinone oxidoreductase subunit C [Dehalococcoidia bacterium]|nr:NADH-quinone oxidoreductase subunit C [Dehalococcoidia bacterium]